MRLLDKIGGYDKLVLAHMGGNCLFSKVEKILAGENIYFDTGCVLGHIPQRNFEGILEKHGEKKILFATDSPWRDQSKDKDIVKKYVPEEGARRRIFLDNARELLGI
jgi:predicted TIM-barrel fold metal-dependent hydrolase